VVKNGGIFGDGKGQRGVFVTWLYMEASLWFYFCTLLEVPEKGRTV